MATYFLIPFDKEDTSINKPKYLSELGTAKGIPSHKKKYYIVWVESKEAEIFLDGKDDVLKISKDTDLTKLNTLIGSDLKIGATRDEMDKATSAWITGKESIFSELLY